MESFTQLEAWKIGLVLVEEIYNLTKKFPKNEQFGLTSQMRRASTSILANLAEGFSRSGSRDKAYKYTIARGECSEIHAFLLVSKKLEFRSSEEAKYSIDLTCKVRKLLSGLINRYS